MSSPTITRAELFVTMNAIVSATVLTGLDKLDPEAYVALVAAALGYAAGMRNGRRLNSGQ